MSADREQRARDAFLRATTPSDETLGRLGDRLDPALRDDPAIRAAALRATTASPEALARIRRRLRARPPRRHPAFAAALALAAAALLAIGAFLLRPDPAAPPADDPIALDFDGEGEVVGTERAPEIRWVAGRLTVRVTPGRGVTLAVTTPEARVEVVGTAFTVERRNRETWVAVTEGRVRVTCAGRPEGLIGPGEQARCLPADATGLLERVAELARAGAPAEERLEAATLALEAGPAGDAARAELLAHRSTALAELGRVDEALAAAEAYLATGESARRPELLGWVARTRFARVSCAARDALEAAVAAVPDRPEALLLATCLVDDEPARARALVEAAGPAATGEWRLLADRLSERLRSGR